MGSTNAATVVLKRPASPSFENANDESSRKRLRGEEGEENRDREEDEEEEEDFTSAGDDGTTATMKLADDLVQELQCGCCSELVYKPVVVSPCQHFFCGSCCVLWIRNGGTSCPACRGESTIVTPSRPLQIVLDTLLRSAPHKARAEGERRQADEIYKGATLRFPSPREISPEPNINLSTEFARPCPHCLPHNPFGWRCPQPIPDPNTDVEHAWRLDDGLPVGHTHCGNCENLLAIQAPSTTKCDFCQVSFCGVAVPGRCIATPLLSQQPHGMSEIADLIQSTEVYECFNQNEIEVEHIIDYLTAQNLAPRHIYREIVAHVQQQPQQFRPLLEQDLFSDSHSVPADIDPDPSAPRNRICRHCATEVLLWGIKEWWIRERQKGFLEEHILKRRDCPDGNSCSRQKDLAHAKEFNHIICTVRAPELGRTNEPTFLPPLTENANAALTNATVSAGSHFGLMAEDLSLLRETPFDGQVP
ncbi:hypothetical protein K435DRAFT_715169 [Dendrothele bispora CBS 962.96]|uniref:RING-type domain-containing protein n=1 Tax=Dendrothele bispora (strain CBS 962.96) TaxID=1314807 RepID=A0A4S8MNL3_DENBC|nr:hypothetical protein K435DRAFT_715169 [Dendrothele bispora CBS 962.96]